MIKFALVGCGRIAKRHADLLGQKQISGAELVAVCDVDMQKAQKLSRQYNVPAYESIEEMIQKSNPDVVSILTPSGLHAEHAVRVANMKKHVVVEKPMALTVADADTMIAACEKNNVRLFVVKQNRFNVPVIKTREALEGGRFGKLIMGTIRVRWSRDQKYYDQDSWRGTWADDGGVFSNQASHHVDLLQWMMGDVESVFTKMDTFLVDIECEDTGVVVLKFKNGALGIIEATTACRPKDLEGSMSIIGEKGNVEVGGFAVNEMRNWNFVNEIPEDKDVKTKYSVNPPNVYGFGHQAYYEHVVESLNQNSKMLVDGHEGKKSLELINAIYESAETKKEVFLKSSSLKSRLGMKAQK